MQAARLSIMCALCFAVTSVCAGQADVQHSPSDPAPPRADEPQSPSNPGQRPLNPTQEVAGQQPEGPALDVGPAKLRIGGYLGLTGIYRSINGGGGTGTRFGSIPYSDVLQGNVSETRLSAESSRVSLRVDADFANDRARFRALAGYLEVDFNGTAPGNVAVTSTSAGLRLRNAFAEVRYRESWFLSAGQAFSLMTPAKDQLSMWPSDVELSQAVDTNYVAGLIWGRFPQVRLAWRPSRAFNWAVSIENPEQQIGNGVVTLPSCCATDIEAQYNTGSDNLGVPNLMPDVVTRVALRPARALHLDVGGVLRAFRHTLMPYAESHKDVGGGVSVNAGLDVTRTTRMIVQSAFGSGLGRYVGGLAPDVSFTRDGSISPIPVVSWVGGLEQKVFGRASVAGYYSGVVSDSRYDQDPNGHYIGYGFPGATNMDNRRIQEVTGTFSTLTVTTQQRGSVQVGAQVSWLTRERWPGGTGPASANAFLFFAQVRYNLP